MRPQSQFTRGNAGLCNNVFTQQYNKLANVLMGVCGLLELALLKAACVRLANLKCQVSCSCASEVSESNNPQKPMPALTNNQGFSYHTKGLKSGAKEKEGETQPAVGRSAKQHTQKAGYPCVRNYSY